MIGSETAVFADFSPLGGSRPDSAVLACAVMSLCDTYLPPDVLDVGLALLCAPPIIFNARHLAANEPLFHCPLVSIRLRTVDPEVLTDVGDMSFSPLTIKVELDASLTELPADFMSNAKSLTNADLRRTSIVHIGNWGFYECRKLLSIKLIDG